MRILFKKVAFFSAITALLASLLLLFLIRNLVSSEFLQDIFFWIILICLTVTYSLFRLRAKVILFTGLFFISIGGVLDIIGNQLATESILRFGYVFLILGSIAALYETFRISDDE